MNYFPQENIQPEEANSNLQNDVWGFDEFPLAASSTQQHVNLSTGFEKAESSGVKRKLQPFDSVEHIPGDEANEKSCMGNKQKKRTRCAEEHSLKERLRRQRLKEKMDTLRELIPNCDKKDKASTIDDAISHIKMLQNQLDQMKSMRGTCLSTCQCPCHSPLTTTQIPNNLPTFLDIAVRGGNGMGHEMPDMFPLSNYPPMRQLELPSSCFLDSSTTPGISTFPMLPENAGLHGIHNMEINNVLETFPLSNYPMTSQLELPGSFFLDSSTTPRISAFSILPDIPDAGFHGIHNMGINNVLEPFPLSNYPTSQSELPSSYFLDSTTPGISTFPLLPGMSDTGLHGIHNVGIANMLEPFHLTTSCSTSYASRGERDFSSTYVMNQESLGMRSSCAMRGSKSRATQ